MNEFYLKILSGKKLLFLIIFLFPFTFSATGLNSLNNTNVEGPGGPILVVTSSTNPFSSYTAEILLAEGFNEFTTSDVSTISSTFISDYDVIIIGEIPLTSTQVTLLSNWVDAGGTLIAFRPDSKLSALLGLQKISGTLLDKYLLINTSSGPGNGLVSETIQYHGDADLYSLNGATSLATLYSSSNTSTSYPAVSINIVGENGGAAVAFSFDLARSIVYTRQGNPAWNGQERDGARPIRSNDLFYPDWVDLSKVEIPQADEQQRLLANIILQNSNKPMPRFWYLPRGLKAAVVMTGDDHASGGTRARFNQYIDLSTDNSPEAVADWRAIRGSSYIYPNTPLSNAEAKYFEDQGFEIALHLNTNCNNYTLESIESNLVTQLANFNSSFPSLADPVSNRTHCIAYSDWASQPIVESANGIRLDANYYYWPDFWVQDRPGFFTGSGLAMRFADLDGTTIDTYQLATQMTDESGQTFPFTIDRLLDNALGSKAYYGIFCANMHTDDNYSPGSDAIIASAISRDVPVISAKQLLTWLDGRNGSSFENLLWDGNALSFNMGIGSGAMNLEAMLPMVSGSKRLIGLTLNNVPVNYRAERIKGIDYAIFKAETGDFIATYDVNEPPVVSIDAPANNATYLAYEDINISAQASDPDGSITRIEFFNGNTKLGEDIDGNDGWAYSWLEVEDGVYNITAKATDDKGSFTFSEVITINVEIDPTNFNCPCTVFEDNVTANNLLNEGTGIQLGMKLTSEIDGYINGIRFYKQNGHTGNHVGQLYDSAGNLLAEAVFINETDSGWQQVFFPNSVPITKNTTYIVSYHSSDGYYSVNDSYFVQAEENRPLKALANGENGSNGVYSLTNTPAFPTSSFEASNYWVDGIFDVEPSIANNPPVVDVLSPLDEEEFQEPATIEITASASDADGQVLKVEFFNGSIKLGEDVDESDGWSYSWIDVQQGNYNIIVKATDDKGSVVESSINVVVTGLPVASNSIVTENSLPGNPQSEWDIDGAGDLSIQGFATDMSYNKGETARFKIDTDANNYIIKIYRLGYYQGNGARYQGDATITASLPQDQPNCVQDNDSGLVDCGNWEESAIWQIPTNAVSGIYLALLTRSNGGSSHIIFVVRDDASNSDLLFQTSDATWQAYNIYGGRSLYTGNGGKASKVSYNRPFLTRDGGGGGGPEEDWVFNAEYPMLRWLERNGYDVTYTTNVDSDRRGDLIKNHRVFLSVGHDEYWSGPHRNYVESARDQGTSLAFFSGNEVYWKTRWENSIDGENDSHRTLVCYKEGIEGENTCSGKCDPTTSWTGLWRDGCEYVTGDPDLDGCRPENTLTGQISWEESTASISVPSTFKDLRFWRNTSVAGLNTGQTASFTFGTIGYEWNSEQEEFKSFYPAGRILLSRTNVDGSVHNISLYKNNNGAFVFGAGTVQWSWGLDENHDRGNAPASPDMQQATINLLADMGAQPASIQPELQRASASSDFQAPALSYSSPLEDAIVPNNSEVLITGSVEEENVIVAVEVSVDGGVTWEVAEGTTDWTYTWTPTLEGEVAIQVRAFDDSGNLSTPEIRNVVVSDEFSNALPVVDITTPVANSEFIAPATVTIEATATDADGTISKVEFFNNGIKLGEDSSSPYAFNWTQVVAGNYNLTARATDDEGGLGSSDAIGITVFSDPTKSDCPCTVFTNSDSPSEGLKNDGQAIQLGMKFRTTVDGIVTGAKFYKQNGDQGTHIGQLYDPSGTVLAEVLFESETTSGWQQASFPTPVNITAGETYIISYHSSEGYYSSDDFGLVDAKINGPVIGLASGEDGDNGVYRYSTTPTFPYFSYQSSNYWIDVIFETEEAPVNIAPLVSITSPLENDSFLATADILFEVEASDEDGTVSSVEFFHETVSIGIDADETDGWNINWQEVTSGNYSLSAIATDNFGESTTSEIINITVEDPNQLPIVAITSPLDNENFVTPTDITITADASDPDGTITQVEFFEGTNSLGIDTDGNDGWSVSWTGVTANIYKLTAIATDENLETTTSEIVTINVEDPNQLPIVAITSPVNNETFNTPTDITITGDASDPDGTITKVEFFEGTNSLGIDTDGNDGWSVNWNGVTANSYAITAVATDDDTETTTSEVINITVEDPNQLPIVAITSPVNNETFNTPTDITITADASDPDGTITKVEFFEGTNSLGIDTDGNDGWSVNWNGVTANIYKLTAIATDENLETTTSEIVTINVEDPNQLPIVAITAPLNNETFTTPTDITITADASDPDGNVTQVEFFEGTNSLGIDTDGNDGWSVNWNGVTANSYVLTAVATDDETQTTTSEVVNITVEDPNQLPIVSITAPLNNETFTTPTDITITADASDPDGTVTQVEFFEGTNSLGIDTDGNDGWSLNWNGVTANNYVLTAVATDDEVQTTTSEVVNITVEDPNQLPIVAITAPLNNETFTTPTDITITADASDPDGNVAQVEFFEGTNSLGIDTDGNDGWSVSWTGVSANNYAITAVATDDEVQTTTSEVVNITVEDPNQLPIVAITSPVNNETFTTPTDITITADASDPDGNVAQVEFFEGTNSLGIDTDGNDGWSLSWTGVTSNSYVLTAVATDDETQTTTSQIINITVEDPIQLPIVAITAPLNNETFTTPTDITITADASDPDGNVAQVEFFEGTNSLGIDTDGNDGWSVSWTGVTANSYVLTAVATDNETQTTTSEIINITVEDPNQLPIVAITAPLNNETFITPTDITITADASDPDGTVTQVEFFEGTNSLGIDTDGNDGWSVSWTGVSANSYDLSAVATDNEAQITTSEIINITVENPNQLPIVAITSPLDNETFTTPTDITITADASDPDGNVAQVEFFEGTNSLGIDTDGNDGWSVSWTGVTVNSYVLTAVATDDDAQITTSEIINITVEDPNQLPIVAITSPLDNETFTTPTDITITADASDPDGNVTQVEFFEGTNSLGIDTDGNDGWSVNWNGVTANSYVLTAVATDDEVQTTTSEIINITVEDPNQLPIVAITSPLDNENFVTPTDITITADASDPDGDVTQVEFFEGTNSLGIDTDGNDGWSVNWNGVTANSYAITAVATDDDTETTTSEVVNITVEDPNQLPIVAITSPLNNETFTTPTDITITANASDPDGNVVQVEFFEGTNSLGIDTDGNDGWSVNWNGVTANIYKLTAIATDENLETTTSEIVTINVEDPNQLPIVAITAPLNNETFTTPTDITITADASDPDGNVVQVEFFEGTNSLGIDTDGNDGWSVNWNGVTANIYKLTAIATDENLETTTSEIVTINVEDPNQLPIVAITAPLNNETFTTPTDITITADASDPDGNVTQVEFFEGTNSLGIDTDGNDGWSVSWIGVIANSYVLTAVATDDETQTTTSEIINITVEDPNQLPIVAITAPLNNETFTTPTDITITADASDPDGTITQVEFFEGANSLGVDTDGNDGWSVIWTDVAANTYVLSAVATDNESESTISDAVTITVEIPLPSITSFIPSSGPVGSLVLLNGFNLDGVTEVSFGPNAAEIVSVSSTQIQVRVPPQNGKLPKGVKISLASPGGQFTTGDKFTVTAGSVPPNLNPLASIVTPVNNSDFIAPAVIEIAVNASDSDGTVSKVEFFNGSTKLGEDLSSPYEFTWSNVSSGSYNLTAVATDDLGATGTSDNVSIQVIEPGGNQAPEITITSPGNNSTFTALANIDISASASDVDGSISQVEFFNGSSSLGVDQTSPYSISWNNVPAGTYSLTAAAQDDQGLVTTSEIVSITVNSSGNINSPTNLAAQWISTSEVYLTWQDNSFNEDGFVLERSTKPDFSGKVDVISIPANRTSYVDSNLNSKKGGGNLYYRIKAVNGNISSNYSNTASAAPFSDGLVISPEIPDDLIIDENDGLTVFPNPTTGNATVLFVLERTRDYNLDFYNSMGTHLLKIGEGKAKAGLEYTFNIEVGQYPDGIYFIILKTRDTNQTIRLIIKR